MKNQKSKSLKIKALTILIGWLGLVVLASMPTTITRGSGILLLLSAYFTYKGNKLKAILAGAGFIVILFIGSAIDYMLTTF